MEPLSLHDASKVPNGNVCRKLGPIGQMARPIDARYWMRDSFARFGGLVTLALFTLAVNGCKQKAAPPAQPVVRSTPRASGPVPSDFPSNDAPVPDSSTVNLRQPRRRSVVAPQVDQTPIDAQAAQEAQERRDAALLKQQEAASQRQQQELNGVVQQSLKIRQEQQAEPRIQDAPEPPPTVYSQSSQQGQDEQRIQDAPGPSQTNPTSAPIQQQASPQL
jgi:hypothetical protein